MRPSLQGFFGGGAAAFDPNAPLDTGGDYIKTPTLDAADGYTLISRLGPPDNTMATISSGVILYTVNGGPAEGQIGNSGTGPGIKFDPTGTGNYGVDDYITPGSPFEGYGFLVNGATWVGGCNSSANYYGGTATSMWDKSTADLNHVICLRGRVNDGFVISQYQTYPGEGIIRIKMSYTNTTGSAVTLKALRGMDPDVGVIQYGTYSSHNYRGYGAVSGTDIVVAEETRTNKPIAIYIPGGGYTHNTAVSAGWPTKDINSILSGPADGDGDYGIFVAWDLGTVDPDQVVWVYCYYLCATIIGDVLKKITG